MLFSVFPQNIQASSYDHDQIENEWTSNALSSIQKLFDGIVVDITYLSNYFKY